MDLKQRGIQLTEPFERLSQKPFFVAVQRGLALPLPLIMVGALALLVRFPPFQQMQVFLSNTFGPQLNAICDNLIAATFGIASLVALLGFSTVLTNQYIARYSQRRANPSVTAMVVLSCFFIIIAPTDDTSLRSALSLNEGLLAALMIAALSGTIFLRLCRLPFMKLPLKAMSHDPLIGDIFAVMPAGILTILLFAAMKASWGITGPEVLSGYLDASFLSLFDQAENNVIFAIAYTGSTQILWFFGIHGPNLLHGIQETILIPATVANNSALSQGIEPSNIFTSQFFDLFVRMGGSGSTLCLILALLLAAKSANSRKFALIAMLPALCNVNEPLLFGIPLVLNPIYAIPFILTPIVQTLIGYVAILFEWMPKTSFNTMWTTPAVISGYVATGSIAGSLIQLISLIIGMCIYLPFVRLAETVSQQRSKKVMSSLMDKCCAHEDAEPSVKFLNLVGEEGRLAIALANELERALDRDDQLYLEYQPQIDIKSKKIFGTEALLRWQHEQYGRIAPPIIVALAEDLGAIDKLGLKVLKIACEQRAEWKHTLPGDFVVSVNVSPKQLLNKNFYQDVLAVLAETGLSARFLELEITESIALLPQIHSIDALRKLQQLGVKIALDDFGMGHTSLNYLQLLPLDTIKLDRSLTISSVTTANNYIIQSIVELGRNMDLSLIVEGVETKDQIHRFNQIGCQIYQGYFFSKPLSATNFETYVNDFGSHFADAFKSDECQRLDHHSHAADANERGMSEELLHHSLQQQIGHAYR